MESARSGEEGEVVPKRLWFGEGCTEEVTVTGLEE